MLTLVLDTLLIAGEYSEEDLDKLEKQIGLYLEFYRKVIGPQHEMQSKAGLRISKFHALLHFPHNIRRYGTTSNFFGAYLLEQALKDIIKQRMKRTT